MSGQSSSAIAVVNAGSSSIKFGLYDSADEALLFRGQIEGIGLKPTLKVADGAGATVSMREWPDRALDHRAATSVFVAIARVLLAGREIAAGGHRVVHGGTRYAEPACGATVFTAFPMNSCPVRYAAFHLASRIRR